jgi:hypothetical protein
MKALLMHSDRDFDPKAPLPSNAQALTQDLELEVLFRAMSGGDDFVLDIARRAVLSGVQNDIDTVTYRQETLKDCLENPAAVRDLYDLAVEAVEEERKHHFFGILSNYPASVLRGSIEQLEAYVGFLKKLRTEATAHAAEFASDGFTALFAMLERELSDDYLAGIHAHLAELKFRDGVLVSAELGDGNEGTSYVLRKRSGPPPSWIERIVLALKRLVPGRLPSHVVRIAERDEAGARALEEIRGRGISAVANALAQSAEHIQGFFRMLRTELAFYIGCLNLHDLLVAKREPVCFPEPTPAGERTHRFQGLYDVSLALSMDQSVVVNTLDLDAKSVVIITGANQGGKSTFLRSVGIAQLMMQSGMFVAAGSFAAELCGALFTHYKREEDASMKSGKLDEELQRMSDIADAIAPRSMLLFNESFAATNEREGSEIARQVVSALHETGMKVLFVTHLYEFAHRLFETKLPGATFLRAERKPDGTRTFRVVEGEPLETSYGEDLYDAVFEDRPGGTAQVIIRSAPASMSAAPPATRQVMGSPSTDQASRTVSARLTLSSGATRDAGPSWRARK